jgi:hypothetical protein
MTKDGEQKPRFAVGVSMEKLPNGALRLVLDDLEIEPQGSGWRHRCLFTHVDLEATAAMEYAMSREEYAQIGDAVVARLLALQALEEEDRG